MTEEDLKALRSMTLADFKALPRAKEFEADLEQMIYEILTADHARMSANPISDT